MTICRFAIRSYHGWSGEEASMNWTWTHNNYIGADFQVAQMCSTINCRGHKYRSDLWEAQTLCSTVTDLRISPCTRFKSKLTFGWLSWSVVWPPPGRGLPRTDQYLPLLAFPRWCRWCHSDRKLSLPWMDHCSQRISFYLGTFLKLYFVHASVRFSTGL